MKRSVNFNGNQRTASRKSARPRNLLAAMKFVGMGDDEQRSFLRRAKSECGCGPTDGCEKCSSAAEQSNSDD